MAKDIRVYASTIDNNLKEYRVNLIGYINDIIEDERGGDRWKPEWRYELLSNEIKAFRSYLNICNEMIDRIPDSKKTIASLKKKLVSILKCIQSENHHMECMTQAKSLVEELAKINL